MDSSFYRFVVLGAFYWVVVLGAFYWVVVLGAFYWVVRQTPSDGVVRFRRVVSFGSYSPPIGLQSRDPARQEM